MPYGTNISTTSRSGRTTSCSSTLVPRHTQTYTPSHSYTHRHTQLRHKDANVSSAIEGGKIHETTFKISPQYVRPFAGYRISLMTRPVKVFRLSRGGAPFPRYPQRYTVRTTTTTTIITTTTTTTTRRQPLEPQLKTQASHR